MRGDLSNCEHREQPPLRSTSCTLQPANCEVPLESIPAVPAPHQAQCGSSSTNERLPRQEKQQESAHQPPSLGTFFQTQDVIPASGFLQPEGKWTRSSSQREQPSSLNLGWGTSGLPRPIRPLFMNVGEPQTLAHCAPPWLTLPTWRMQIHKESTSVSAFTDPSTAFQPHQSSALKRKNVPVASDASEMARKRLTSPRGLQATLRHSHAEERNISLGASSGRQQPTCGQVPWLGQHPLAWPNGLSIVPQQPAQPFLTEFLAQPNGLSIVPQQPAQPVVTEFLAQPPHKPGNRLPPIPTAWVFPGSNKFQPSPRPINLSPLVRMPPSSLPNPGHTHLSRALYTPPPFQVDLSTKSQTGALIGTALKAAAHNMPLTGQSCSASSETPTTWPVNSTQYGQLFSGSSVLNLPKDRPPPPYTGPGQEAKRPVPDGGPSDKNSLPLGSNLVVASSHSASNLWQPPPCREEQYSSGGSVFSVPQTAFHSVKPMPLPCLVKPVPRHFANAGSVPQVEKQDGLNTMTSRPDFQETSTSSHLQLPPLASERFHRLLEFLSCQAQATPEMLEVLSALQKVWDRLQEGWPFFERVHSSLRELLPPLARLSPECPRQDTLNSDRAREEPAQHEHEYIPEDALNVPTPRARTSMEGHSALSDFTPATALGNEECGGTTARSRDPRCTSLFSNHETRDSVPLSSVGSEAVFLKETERGTTPEAKAPKSSDEKPRAEEAAAEVTTPAVEGAENLVAALNARTCNDNAEESLHIRLPEQARKSSIVLNGSRTPCDGSGWKYSVPRGHKSVQPRVVNPVKANNVGSKRKGDNKPRRKRRWVIPRKTPRASKEPPLTKSSPSSDEGNLIIDLGPESIRMDECHGTEGDTQTEITSRPIMRRLSSNLQTEDRGSAEVGVEAGTCQSSATVLNAQTPRPNKRQYRRRVQTSAPRNETAQPTGTSHRPHADGEQEPAQSQSQAPLLGWRHEYRTAQSEPSSGSKETILSDESRNGEKELNPGGNESKNAYEEPLRMAANRDVAAEILSLRALLSAQNQCARTSMPVLKANVPATEAAASDKELQIDRECPVLEPYIVYEAP